MSDSGQLPPIHIEALTASGGAGEFTPARAAALDQIKSTAALLSGTANAPIVLPIKAAAPSPSSGASVWGLGAYVQVVGSGVIAAGMIIGVFWDTQTAGADEWDQWDIGVGASGAEVVVATGSGRRAAISPGSEIVTTTFFPGIKVAANARIAVRFASSATGAGGRDCYVAYLPTPIG